MTAMHREESQMKDLLRTTAERAARYLAGLKDRGVAPTREALANLERLDEAFPEHPTDPSVVVRLLDDIGSPATMASAGRLAFGCARGGARPRPAGARHPGAPGRAEARVRPLPPRPSPARQGTARR